LQLGESDEMSRAGETRTARRRAMAIGASAAAHALVFIALIWQAPSTARYLAPPAETEVQLSAPWPLERPPPKHERSAVPAPSTAAATVRTTPAISSSASAALTPITPESPVTTPAPLTPPAETNDHAGSQAALRASVGCDSADYLQLTTFEQQHCRDRLAHRSGAVAANLDPKTRAAFHLAAKNDIWWQRPFLAGPQGQGCGLKLSHTASAAAAANAPDTSVVLTCRLRF
jgi:hypothetical protein